MAMNSKPSIYKPSDYMDMLMSSLHHCWEGFRTDTLKQHLKSWEVFPVEEARVVQEFLEQVQEEVEEEGEEMSASELLQKLERLEVR